MNADAHDDNYNCTSGPRCVLRPPTSDELAAINAEVQRLESMTDKPMCNQVGTAVQSWLSHGNAIQFFDNKIYTSNDQGQDGFLGGDVHPDNNPNDPYQGQIHIYGNGRSTAEKLKTFRHEAAHVWGAPDGMPSSSSDPYSWNGAQIADYCQ